MQIGGKDVKVLTCDSCVKSYKPSSLKESQDLSSSPSQYGYEHSPYPDIDIFISRVINKGGIQGEIRRWVFFPQGKLLTYDILKNRWCENIGRPHKSNHIMIVVDLRLGVYYQKCHDPDCKRIDYRSPERPIPDEINPLSNTQYGEFFESDDDDDDQELCKAAAECEELGCDDMNRNCRSSEKQDGTLTTEYNREEVYASGTSSHIKWDEDEDDRAMLQVEIPEEGYRSSTRILIKCPQNTIEALQGNNTRECSESLDSGNKRSSLNYKESIDTMRSEKVIRRPENNLIGSDNNKLYCASDEDVCNWLDEDPVSDLELSFAAEEVELKETLATDFNQ